MFGGGYYGGGSGGGYSSIPLAVRVPQMPNQEQFIGQMMSMQNALQMRDLRQAEINNQNLEAQTRQHALGFGQAASDVFAQNPSSGQPGQPQGAQQPGPPPQAAPPQGASYSSMGPVLNPGQVTTPAAPQTDAIDDAILGNVMTTARGSAAPPAAPAQPAAAPPAAPSL